MVLSQKHITLWPKDAPEEFRLQSIDQGLMEKLFMEAKAYQESKFWAILEDNGHSIKDRIELEEFLETRCQILEVQDSAIKYLTVDDIAICYWSSTREISSNSENGKITLHVGEVTAIRPIPNNRIKAMKTHLRPG